MGGRKTVRRDLVKKTDGKEMVRNMSRSSQKRKEKEEQRHTHIEVKGSKLLLKGKKAGKEGRDGGEGAQRR